MPVFKVPVQHKFGIISHSKRVELQQRLLRQTHEANQASTGFLQRPHAPPFKVSEEFVQKYNLATLEEKEVLQDQAAKLLERSKRRCGLSTSGEGNHVDLPLAWSELAVLAQCKGKLQEDCFDILCISLNEAPLSEENIPTLFFLAESTLYWLRTDAMKQPYLRASEVKLLKMGHLVFTRLLFHHLSGHLRGLAEIKIRLHSYLDGLKSQQILYQSYPGVLLNLRYIDQVGEIVIGPYAKSANKSSTSHEVRVETVPGLAASVYRSLCLWRVAAVTKVNLKRSTLSLLMAIHELSSEDWINGFLALSLLGEAAKVDIKVCQTLQDIACGKTTLEQQRAVQRRVDHFPTATADSKDSEVFHAMESNFKGKLDDLMTSFEDSIETTKVHSFDVNLPKPKPSAGVSDDVRKEMSFHDDSQQQGSTKAQPLTGIGSWCWENAYQYTQILIEVCLHGWTSDIQKSALMGKWQDADVTTFRAGMGNPCTESSGLADLLEYSGPQLPSSSRAQAKKHEWAWKVRYGALSGLTHLTHTLHGSTERTGMRSAAWSLITAMQECPTTEDRVLEAIRVSHIEFTNKIKRNASKSVWTRIAESLSDIYLVSPNMPPVTPTSPTPSQRSPRRPRATPTSEIRKTPIEIKRPTIREEILIHTSIAHKVPSFNTRTSFDLKRVVADQWRKELIAQQKEDEKNFQIELEAKRKEEEEQEEERLRKRKEKLKGKSTALLAPYEVNFTRTATTTTSD